MYNRPTCSRVFADKWQTMLDIGFSLGKKKIKNAKNFEQWQKSQKKFGGLSRIFKNIQVIGSKKSKCETKLGNL